MGFYLMILQRAGTVDIKNNGQCLDITFSKARIYNAFTSTKCIWLSQYRIFESLYILCTYKIIQGQLLH